MEHWDTLAKEMGYSSTKEMWTEMYDRFSLASLAQRFGISQKIIRDQLIANGVGIKSRGGANFQKIEVTDALIEKVKTEGIAKVAKDLGVDKTTLYKRLYYKSGIKLRDLKNLQDQML